MKKGWQTKRLSEVCEKITDGTHQTPTYFDNGVLFLSSRNVTSGTIDWENVKYIDAKQHGEMQRRVSPRLNDILLAKNGTTGVAAMVDRDVPFDIYVSLALLRPLAAVRPAFLLHFINSPLAKEQFTKRLKGIGVPNLHLEEIREVVIPVPPLAEQQRIVGLLDEAFEGLATAKANAEKNLQNARALFESHLQSVFTQRGPGWAEKSLGETCEMYQPKTIGTKDLVPNGPYPVFGANGVIGRYDKFNHEEPQLLVTCRGATCGSVNISEPNSWITGNAMVVRPLDHSLDLKFLEFVFRGGIDISKAITGAAQPQITRTNLSPLLIRFPKSVAEQTKLAEQFESLTEETQRLARLYERKHAALEALKKSLLHQAFTGAL